MTGARRRISSDAYQALRDALPVIVWYKKSFSRYLRAAFRDCPEILEGLDYVALTKREITDEIVDRLLAGEERYQATTLQLMLEIGNMVEFPDLRSHQDSDVLLARAEDAVATLRKQTEQHSALVVERERIEAEAEARRQQDDVRRRFSDELATLKRRYDQLQIQDASEQLRGKAFERFLRDLFELFDLEPRVEYSLSREQIDGAFSFDTDDYIVEAKWLKGPVSREQADIFAAKVRRKGKSALGLFVSVNGFSADAREEYSQETPFMTMDGADLYAVLEQRVRLDDMLRRKKRHANETGECYYPAYLLFG